MKLHDNMEKEMYVNSTYFLTRNVLEINKSLLFLLKYCIYTVQTYLQSKIRIQKCTGKSTCTVSGALGNDLKIKFDRLRTVYPKSSL